MELIYRLVEKHDWDKLKKSYIFLFANVLVFSLIGLIIWAIFFSRSLKGIEWMFCFMGYPGFFAGFIGGLIKLYDL